MTRAQKWRAWWRGFFGFFYPPLLPAGTPHLFTRTYWGGGHPASRGDGFPPHIEEMLRKEGVDPKRVYSVEYRHHRDGSRYLEDVIFYPRKWE